LASTGYVDSAVSGLASTQYVETAVAGTYSRQESDLRYASADDNATRTWAQAAFLDASEGDARFASISGNATQSWVNSLFHTASNTWTRVEADSRYAPLSDNATQSWVNGRFHTAASTWTRTESANRFAPASADASQSWTDTNFHRANETYTRSESDSRFAAASGNATQAWVAANVHWADGVYTKVQSDSRFAPLSGNATQSWAQGTFLDASEGDARYARIEDVDRGRPLITHGVRAANGVAYHPASNSLFTLHHTLGAIGRLNLTTGDFAYVYDWTSANWGHSIDVVGDTVWFSDYRNAFAYSMPVSEMVGDTTPGSGDASTTPTCPGFGFNGQTSAVGYDTQSSNTHLGVHVTIPEIRLWREGQSDCEALIMSNGSTNLHTITSTPAPHTAHATFHGIYQYDNPGSDRGLILLADSTNGLIWVLGYKFKRGQLHYLGRVHSPVSNAHGLAADPTQNTLWTSDYNGWEVGTMRFDFDAWMERANAL